DPTVSMKVLEGIEDYLNRHKFNSIYDIIGTMTI
ncbi:MAG TPA: dihydroorotate dehydrogenase, partial [Paludibacter sp.]|nr:dihydroorotate dehydrogenase [Paludibacter sp.]